LAFKTGAYLNPAYSEVLFILVVDLINFFIFIQILKTTFGITEPRVDTQTFKSYGAYKFTKLCLFSRLGPKAIHKTSNLLWQKNINLCG
jgi:hypothetical protein